MDQQGECVEGLGSNQAYPVKTSDCADLSALQCCAKNGLGGFEANGVLSGGKDALWLPHLAPC